MMDNQKDTAQEVWNWCLERLAVEQSEYEMTTWIRPLRCEVLDQSLKIHAPNAFVGDWINDHHLERIKELVAEQFSHLSVQVCTPNPQDNSNVNKKKKETRSRPSFFFSEKSDAPQSDHTFSLYIEGRSNRLARTAALVVAESSQKGYNPLFIYGDSGLGKTHLLHAIANRYREKNPKAKVAYTNSSSFLHNMVTAIKLQRATEFSEFYRSHDILLLDDFQFLSGKAYSLEEFFNTFNTLIQSGRQVVITSDRFHRDLPDVSDRLSSRLGSGLQVRVDPPEYETRVVILESKAAQLKLGLSEDIIDFIAKCVRSNVRELEGVLHRIKANHELFGDKIDLSMVKTLMRDLLQFQERQVSIDNIIRIVAEYYSLRTRDLLSSSRPQRIARPRQLAMYLSCELTQLSLPAIGNAFGGRDHSTVLHARRKIQKLLESDTQIQSDYRNIEKKLYW